MKKSLLLLALSVCTTVGIAQQTRPTGTPIFGRQPDNGEIILETYTPAPTRSIINNVREAGDYTEYETMVSIYDYQTGGSVGNRIARFGDGAVGVVSTWSQEEGFADRGTGYNYYNPSTNNFNDFPEARVESFQSASPSIASFGNSVILASRGKLDGETTSVNIFKRDLYYTGEWQLIGSFPGLYGPRVAASNDGKYIHVVANTSYQAGNYNTFEARYIRSADGGATWSEPVCLYDNGPEGQNGNVWTDEYEIAVNGNNVAILFGGFTSDLFYMISHDNGETWEQVTIFENPYPHFDFNVAYETGTPSYTNEDYIYSCDNTHSIAIGDDGTVHVVFATGIWSMAEQSYGYGYYYWWDQFGSINYWNSNYTNEQGGHQIPNVGDWSGDETNGFTSINDKLSYSRMFYLAEADNYENLNVFGYVSEAGNTYPEYDAYDTYWGTYYSFGLATWPGIALGDDNSIAVIYSVLSDLRNDGSYWYRTPYITQRDKDGNWYYDEINLFESALHFYDEGVVTTALTKAENGEAWFTYMYDDIQGMYAVNYGQYSPSNNCLNAIKLQMYYDNVAEVNPINELNAYPNPTTADQGFNISVSMDCNADINFLNLAGQSVKNTNKNLTAGYNEIETNDLESGVYFCTISSNGYTTTTKIVIR